MEGKFLLLDGCCRCDVEKVRNYIEIDLNKKFRDLKLVVSTHSHPDHMGGVYFFQKQGIPIAGSTGGNLWYSGVSGFFTYWIDIFLTYLVAINKKRGVKNILYPRKVKFDHLLHEQSLIPGFEDWIVLECPGHTNTDLTLFHAGESIAYVADNFVGSQRKVFRPYPLFSPSDYKKTLRRYLDLEIKTFLIAHHGEIHIPQERIEKLIQSTPNKARRHLNTLPAIFLKLFKSLLKKF